MRKELNEMEMDMVTGGAVAISKEDKTVAFTTVGKKYPLINITPEQARNEAYALLDAHPEMSPREFDVFCAKQFRANGWI